MYMCSGSRDEQNRGGIHMDEEKDNEEELEMEGYFLEVNGEQIFIPVREG